MYQILVKLILSVCHIKSPLHIHKTRNYTCKATGVSKTASMGGWQGLFASNYCLPSIIEAGADNATPQFTQRVYVHYRVPVDKSEGVVKGHLFAAML